jgi:hypothetical protein
MDEYSDNDSTGSRESLVEAIELASELANKYDTIRRKYWNLRIMKLKERQRRRQEQTATTVTAG